MIRIPAVLLTFILCFVQGGISDAGEYRNILSGSYIDYGGAGISRTWENTLIARWSPRMSTVARIYRDDRASWDNTIATGGIVYLLTRADYIELTGGYGRDSDHRDSHHYSLELTHENARYLAGIGLRQSSYPGFTVNVASPGVRWNFTRRLAWWGKYFASRDSRSNFDQSYWTELIFSPIPAYSFAAGVTGGNRLYSPGYESQSWMDSGSRFHSWLVRGSWEFTPRMSARMQYEHLTRDHHRTDHKSTLLLDARF